MIWDKGIVAGLIGLGGGAPSLRIKGFYLAVATIAIHFVVMWLIPHLEITRKTQGLHPPAPQIGSFAFDSDERIYYIILTVMPLDDLWRSEYRSDPCRQGFRGHSR